MTTLASGTGGVYTSDRRTEKKFALAWDRHRAADFVKAERLYRQVLAVRPAHQDALNRLGYLLGMLDRAPEAVPIYQRLLDVCPTAEAHNNLAVALNAGRRRDEAMHHFQRAIAINPNWGDAHAGMAAIILRTGDLERGFGKLEYRKFQSLSFPTGATAANRWNGEFLNGQTCILHHEFGFGDTLQFVRYAPMVAARGAKVVIAAPVELQRLLSRMDGVADVVTTRVRLINALHCPMLSLPVAFRTRLDTIPANIPYFRANPVAWAKALPGLKVGLCWSGSYPKDRIDAWSVASRRNMTLADMVPILAVSGCSFVSLQQGPPAAELRMLPAGMVIDMTHTLTDWQDTADLIAALDVVITVDTAVCHVAGALGKPVLMASRFDGCWRWLAGQPETPWYHSMRVYTQPSFGDWQSVVADIVRDLSHFVAKDRYVRQPTPGNHHQTPSNVSHTSPTHSADQTRIALAQTV